MAALQQYGLARGLLLTAWRLLRCNPLGREDWYDPPRRIAQRWFFDAEGRERLGEAAARRYLLAAGALAAAAAVFAAFEGARGS